MTRKIFIVGVFGIAAGMINAFAGEAPAPMSSSPVNAQVNYVRERFNCTFEGPAVVVKGALPLVCTAFGEFTNSAGTATPVPDGDHLTLICGNSVLYSDGLVAFFPTTTATELRSIVPGVADLTIRSLNPGVFTGPLGSVLRIDIPGTPQALLTGVCHLNPYTIAPPTFDLYDSE